MCTLSWQWQTGGYELWFSRDESVTRPLAVPPEPTADGWALASRDPQGGGTWLAVTRAGVCFALLNAYELDTRAGDTHLAVGAPERISRGTLIPALLRLQTPEAIVQVLRATLGPRYAPFRLCVLWPHRRVDQWCWQGQALVPEQATAPVVSSGQHTAQVRAVRAALFATMVDDLHGFHTSYQPEKGYLSVCMHRPEAHTVSLSHVQVGPERVVMRYQGGAPCEGQTWQTRTLVREGQ